MARGGVLVAARKSVDLSGVGVRRLGLDADGAR